ncbi:MAG TPA: translocation/assembly module TamB [Pricia antarctica]|uniref:Translocation/assembly module TamB n=3 Tax=root TaxID=1 RepID=A0A831QQ79_9FLAO|nr:translocation/assembly module TamB [Pricia antarctica]
MEKKKRKYRILRRIGRIILVVLLLFVALVLFIRSPWGQNVIVTKATDYVSSKTDTKVEIDRLFLTFSGNLSLEGLYLEDKKGDTLLYSKALEADVGLSDLIFGTTFDLEYLKWEGLKANVIRAEGSEDFNFTFLMDAFAAQDSVPAPEAEASEPMKISIGSIDLTDFDIVYEDGFLGIDSKFRLGRLYVEANTIDLEAMRFELDDIELIDTEAEYTQTKPFPETEDTTETALPYLVVDNFKIEKVRANYNSEPDSLKADVNIGNFLLEMPKANLAQNDIEVETLELKNSDIAIRMPAVATQPQDTTAIADTGFEWPEFLVKVDAIDIDKNKFAFVTGSHQSQAGTFNADAVSVSNFTFQAENITYRPKLVNLELTKLAFNESSGFQLKNFAFDANLEEDNAAISGLVLQTNNSAVSGDLSLKYASVDALIENPENTTLTIDIPDLNLAIQDAYVFQPDLADNEYVQKAAKRPITGTIKADGRLSNIKIPDFKVNWGGNTSLTANGTVKNAMNPDSLYFDFSNIRATSNRTDLLQFVNEDSLGISVPETLVIDASAKGLVDDMAADVVLKIPEGTAQIAGSYSNRQRIAFDGTLKVDSLQLDKILKNEQLGGVSFTIDAKGSGNDIGSLNASLRSNFQQLSFDGYDYSNLVLEGDVEDGKGDIDLNFKDSNLNLMTNVKVDLDSLESNIQLDLNLIGADLQALGLTQENIRAGLQLNANFKGSAEDFTLNALLSEGTAVYDNKQYKLDKINVEAGIDTISTKASINSEFLKAALRSNAAPDKITAALNRQFEAYFSESAVSDTISEPVNLEVNLAFKSIPILSQVFLKGLERLDTLNLKADFDASTKKLMARLDMPTATYAGSTIDSLEVAVDGTATDLNFSAGLAALLSGPVQIKRTLFKGDLRNRQMGLDFSSFDDTEQLVHLAAQLNLEKDTINLHIEPENLVFNRKKWTIEQNNRISSGEKLMRFENFTLSRNDQRLTLSNAIAGEKNEHIGVTFDNFKLQTFLSLLNPDEALAGGIVKGNVIVENPFGATGIVADFNINELQVMKNALGNLSLNAASKGQKSYDFDLALKDGGIDFDLTGDYTAAETGAVLDLDLVLNKLEMSAVEGLSDGAIKDTEGYLSGNVKVSGTTADPKYEGQFNFNQLVLNPAMLNSVFKIDDETLNIDNSGLYFDTFTITDAQNNAFEIGGSILTEELTNPTFDLTLKADAFQVLNSTEEDNELFYGKASFDTDMTVGGNLDLPKIEGKLKIRKITDVTFVVPEEQLDVQERDGVVIFVNRENPDAILTTTEEEEAPELLQGMDVEAILEIANDAVFNVIIDKKSGDNLQVSGEAELNLSIEPNGRVGLSGRYEVQSGHYETSLYNLVKRRFELNPGSTVTWRGDPMDAELDVTAVYNVETSAAPLMTTVDPSSATKYQQVLPFMVYLNVKGELMEPKLSFGMDMPEDDQGALGGAVYGRVQQLNEQESELNKQVFSLLALNKFFPASGSDGSGGGTAALAKDNVNKMLSGQLNSFSDKVFGNTGIDLNFDLDSFTDYQGDSPQDRTQLNINAQKKLFDNRLIVTAGSAVDVEGSSSQSQGSTPIIGNVSLEYLLTENGRYRLRGFRKNEYTNVIDGQLIVTGAALIFNREFNEFSELFNPLKDTDLENANKGNSSDVDEKEEDKKDDAKKKDADTTDDANKDGE